MGLELLGVLPYCRNRITTWYVIIPFYYKEFPHLCKYFFYKF